MNTQYPSKSALPFSLICAFVAALVAAPPANAEQAGDEYAIHLKRPMHVGLRFREITTAKYEQLQEVRQPDGRIERASESWQIDLECDQDVLETTPKGSPKKYRLEFNGLTRTRDGRKETLLKKGTVVVADKPGEDSIFKLESTGQELGEELSAILDDLFGLSNNDDTTTSEDVFGSDKPRKVGERWSANLDKARAWFGPEREMRISTLSGESTFIRLVKVGDEPCMEIGHTLSVRSSSPMFNFMQGGISPERHFFWSMRSMLPLDPTRMDRGYHMMRSIRETVPFGGQEGAVTEITINSAYDTEIIPLPPSKE